MRSQATKQDEVEQQDADSYSGSRGCQKALSAGVSNTGSCGEMKGSKKRCYCKEPDVLVRWLLQTDWWGDTCRHPPGSATENRMIVDGVVLTPCSSVSDVGNDVGSDVSDVGNVV